MRRRLRLVLCKARRDPTLRAKLSYALALAARTAPSVSTRANLLKLLISIGMYANVEAHTRQSAVE